MTTPVAHGWDVVRAVNRYVPIPAGGRIVSLAPMPCLMQDSYGVYHGTTYQARAFALMVDSIRWIRGGRTTGTVYVGAADTDLSWYAEGENAPAVGAAARAALEAAGFTVVQFSGSDLVAALAACDVLVYDGTHNTYDTAQNADIIEAVTTNGKGILYAWSPNPIGSFGTHFGLACTYAYLQGPSVTLYGWTGAEAIFDRSFGAGSVAIHTYGGKGSIAGGAGGETFPSSVVASWRNASNAAHHHVVGTWTQHGDSGEGDSWT